MLLGVHIEISLATPPLVCAGVECQRLIKRSAGHMDQSDMICFLEDGARHCRNVPQEVRNKPEREVSGRKETAERTLPFNHLELY